MKREQIQDTGLACFFISSAARHFAAALFLFAICLAHDTCLADLLSPAQFYPGINSRPLKTGIIDSSAADIVASGHTKADFGLEYGKEGRDTRRGTVYYPRPVKFSYALRFPGPCKYSLTFRDGKTGKIILQNASALPDMYFLPVSKCIKGRKGDWTVADLKKDAKQNSVPIKNFIKKLEKLKNFSRNAKGILNAQIIGAFIPGFGTIDYRANDEISNNKCFYYSELYDYRVSVGELKDERFDKENSVFTLVFDLDVNLIGYDYTDRGAIPNTGKDKTEKLKYKIRKKKTLLTVCEVLPDGSEKEIEKFDISDNYGNDNDRSGR